jgi:glycolate oxidase iron-sulfur subunit
MMQTNFSPEQLEDSATRTSEGVIRKCVHCGFCTATCPTYVLLGDELDSPRGRIYLMKNMLEEEQKPSAEVVKHIDRCLSCLSCMTTCPSGVNYMQLVDHARTYIEDHYRRPLLDRLTRSMLAFVLPHRGRFRAALTLGKLARSVAPILARFQRLKPFAAMLTLAVTSSASGESGAAPIVSGQRKGRVIMLRGCAEPVLRPAYQLAAARLLARAGYAVESIPEEGCCGALVHHMGREEAALAAARRNIDLWRSVIAQGDVAAILLTSSGCGTVIKNYGFMLRDDGRYAEAAAEISALARDITEFLDEIDLPQGNGNGLRVAYHPACSLQHGQKVTDAPKRLLADYGYAVSVPAEAHLCCGSAGTYNILQPDIAGQLGARKAAAIERLQPDVIATGNIGCAIQIGGHSDIPVVHTVELLDWASGGPVPAALATGLNQRRTG